MLLHRANLEVARLASVDVTRAGLGGLLIEPGFTIATDGHVLGAIAIARDIDAREFPHVGDVTPRPSDCGWCMPCWPCVGAELVRYDVAIAERVELEAAPLPGIVAGAAIALPPPLPTLASSPRWHECTRHRPDATRDAIACPVELEWTLRPCIIARDAALTLLKQIPTGKLQLPVLGRVLVDVPATNLNGTVRAVTTDLEQTRPLETRKVDAEPFAWRAVMPKGDQGVTVGVNPALLAKVLEVAVKAGVGTVTLRVAGELDPIVIEGVVKETGAAATFLVMPCRI